MGKRLADDGLIALLALVFFIGGMITAYVFVSQHECNYSETTIAKVDRVMKGNMQFPDKSFFASVLLPAVMANGTGVYAQINVLAKNGTGKIFVRTDSILVNDDTQQSIRKAALVAANLADVNLSTVDLIYELSAPATELEGASAGAAIAIATYAALTNSSLRHDVMMTGSINHDGSVGFASKVIEKARVADELGMQYFLVPKGTIQKYSYIKREFCYEWRGGIEFCDEEYVPEKTELWNLSVRVIEIGTIDEALRYFLEE